MVRCRVLEPEWAAARKLKAANTQKQQTRKHLPRSFRLLPRFRTGEVASPRAGGGKRHASAAISRPRTPPRAPPPPRRRGTSPGRNQGRTFFDPPPLGGGGGESSSRRGRRRESSKQQILKNSKQESTSPGLSGSSPVSERGRWRVLEPEGENATHRRNLQTSHAPEHPLRREAAATAPLRTGTRAESQIPSRTSHRQRISPSRWPMAVLPSQKQTARHCRAGRSEYSQTDEFALVLRTDRQIRT
jgi:hypothetical protein